MHGTCGQASESATHRIVHWVLPFVGVHMTGEVDVHLVLVQQPFECRGGLHVLPGQSAVLVAAVNRVDGSVARHNDPRAHVSLGRRALQVSLQPLQLPPKASGLGDVLVQRGARVLHSQPLGRESRGAALLELRD